VKKFYLKCQEGLDVNYIAEDVYGLDASLLKKRALEGLKATRKNLQTLGKLYDETSSVLKGSFAIKHGYKVIHKSKESEAVFNFDDGDHLIMAQLKKVENYPSSAGLSEKFFIDTARLTKRDGEDELKLVEKMVNDIGIYATQIREIADMNMRKLEDKYFYLSASLDLVDIGVNESCPCESRRRSDGQFEKYKKCHGLK